MPRLAKKKKKKKRNNLKLADLWVALNVDLWLKLNRFKMKTPIKMPINRDEPSPDTEKETGLLNRDSSRV